jgi:hypothetical protein
MIFVWQKKCRKEIGGNQKLEPDKISNHNGAALTQVNHNGAALTQVNYNGAALTQVNNNEFCKSCDL